MQKFAFSNECSEEQSLTDDQTRKETIDIMCSVLRIDFVRSWDKRRSSTGIVTSLL